MDKSRYLVDLKSLKRLCFRMKTAAISVIASPISYDTANGGYESKVLKIPCRMLIMIVELNKFEMA